MKFVILNKKNSDPKKILVWDLDYGAELASRFVRDGHEVYYYTEWAETFPVFRRYAVGLGFDGLKKVKKFFKYIDKVDYIVFLGRGDLCDFLRNKGYRVFGAGRGESLEMNRPWLKKILKDIGILSPPYKLIKGVDNVLRYLKNNPNKWIKHSIFRGDKETFFAKDEESARTELNLLRSKLGPFEKTYEFVVEDNIEDIMVETGWDLLFNGHDFIKPYLWGYCMSRFYAGKYTNEMPPLLSDLADKLKPVLSGLDYRGPISVEVQIDKKGRMYFTDVTCIYGSKSQVYTSKGWKDICKVQNGDLVLTHKGRFRKVIEKKIFSNDEMIKIQLQGHKYHKVTFTPEHPILTKSGWKRAENININDEIMVKAVECAECKKLIVDFSHRKLSQKFKKNFCSKSCASKYSMREIKDTKWFRERIGIGRKRSYDNWTEKDWENFSKIMSKRSMILWNDKQKSEDLLRKLSHSHVKEARIKGMLKTIQKIKDREAEDPEFRNFRKINRIKRTKYMVENRIGLWSFESNRKKGITRKKRLNEDYDFYLRTIENLLNGKRLGKNKDTFIERRLNNSLDLIGLIVEKQYKFYYEHEGRKRVFYLDFAIPDKKIAIECDGYRHSLPQAKKCDQFKDEILSKNGWNILRFDGSEIKKDPNKCAEEVKRIYMNHNGEMNKFMFVKVNKVNHYRRKKKGAVYNLQVDGDESFIVNGMVVHNCRFPLPLSFCYTKSIKNYSDVMFSIAEGKGIEMDIESKYVGYVEVRSLHVTDNWLKVNFPDKYKDNIKFRQPAKLNDSYYGLPSIDSLLAVVVDTNSSINTIFDRVVKISEEIGASGSDASEASDSVNRIKDEIRKGRRFGLDF